MENLGVRVDEVLSNLLKQVDTLRAENVQKSEEVDQLTKVVSDNEAELAKLKQHLFEQQRDFHWLRLKFDAIQAQQAAVIELLETKLGFSRSINEKLCELIYRSSENYQARAEQLSREVESLREAVATADHYKQKMELLLSEALNQANPEISDLLERYASDVRDARREKNFFEAMLRKFKGDDRDSREGFFRLCGELIEKQKQFIESQRSPPHNPPAS